MSETRARIVTATNELFRVQGYHGTSLSQISEASGATTGSIYHFFPGGKDELSAAVIETTAVAYRELFQMISGEAADAPSAIIAFFQGAADVLAESDYIDPCPIGTVAREVASTNEPLRLAAAAAFESWIRAVTDYLRSEGVDDADAGELAVVFVAAVEGSFVVSRTMRSPEPMNAAARRLSPVIAAALEHASVS